MTIRVLLADDQEMVRAGLRLILAAEPDIEVVAETGDGHDAVATARRLHPDVTLMDIRMPQLDGIQATRQLLAATPPPTRVVVLTTFDIDSYVYEALRAGASGFLLKNASPERLVQAIRVVASGDGLLDPAITRRVIEEFARTPAAAQPPEAARATRRRGCPAGPGGKRGRPSPAGGTRSRGTVPGLECPGRSRPLPSSRTRPPDRWT